MIGLFASLCLALGVILWLAGRSETFPSRAWVIGAVYAVPALLLCGLLWTARDRFGDFHLSLLSVSYEAKASQPRFSIGGDGASDDIVVNRAPAALIRAAGPMTLTVDPFGRSDAPGGAEAAVVAVERGGTTTLAGARPLAPGDRFCLQSCTAPGADWFTLREDGRGLKLIGGSAQLPAFPARWPAWVHWSPQQRIFALRDYAAPANRPFRGGNGCEAGRHYCIGGGAQPARSFLYRTGGLSWRGGGQLWIMLLDRGAALLPAGSESGSAAISGPARLPFVTDVGRVEKLSIFEIFYAGPDVELGDREEASRLIPRQALNIGIDSTTGIVSFQPTRAPIETITRDAIARAASPATAASRNETRPVVLDLVAGRAEGQDAEQPGNPLPMPLVGTTLARAAAAVVIIEDGGASGRSVRVEGAIGPNGQRVSAPIGTPFRIGAGAGQTAATLQIDIFELPLLAYALALGWTLIFALAQMRIWLVNPVNWMVLTVVQLLLAVRVLIAIGGVALDPRRASAQPIGSSLVAFIVLPLILAALAPRPGGTKRDLWWPALFAAAAAAAVHYGIGPVDRFHQILAAAGVATAVLWPLRAPIWQWSRAQPPCRWAGAAWARLRRRIQSLASQVPRWIAAIASASRRLPWWAAMILGACLIRIVLAWGFGIRERLPFFPYFALTVFYVPMLLIGFAGLLQAARQSPAVRPLMTAMACVALACLPLLAVPALLADQWSWVRAGAAAAVYLALVGALAMQLRSVRRAGAAGPSDWRRFAVIAAAGLLLLIAPIAVIDGLGVVLALAVVFYALLLLGAAALLKAASRPLEAGPGVPLGIVMIALLLLSLVMLPLGVVSDWGLSIFAIGIAIYALSLIRWTGSWWQAGTWAATALALPLFFTVLTEGVPRWQNFDWRGEIASALNQPEPDHAAAAAVLGRIASNNNNLHRVRLISHPDQVSSAGTDVAERLVRWSGQLRQYGSSNVGEGFLAPSTIGDLWPVQADDNVSAVHLLYPYGRTGTALFLGVLGLLAWAAARRSRAPPDAARIAGELALWTLFTVAVYMVLANLLVVPFTGRNIYFLAAFSNSDLLEGGLLAFMALYGLGREART